MSRKKILVLSDRIPNDSSSPGAPRIFELCNALKEDFSFSYYLISEEEKHFPEHASSLFEVIHQETFDPAIYSLPKKLFRWCSPTASFDYRTTHKNEVAKITSHIEHFFHEHSFDGILIDRLRCSQFISESLKQFSILDLCDCLTKLQIRAYADTPGLRKKISNTLEVLGLWRWERSEIKKFRYTTLVSGEDVAPLRFGFFSVPKPYIVPLGISMEYFTSTSPLPENYSLIFFGTLDYQPNVDACKWLVHEIFPLVRESFPEAVLQIVGANASKEILDFADLERISVHTNVPDIRPYIESNAIFLSPIRLGAGVKNKTLVSMSMERPVISTEIGLEGLTDVIKKQAMIANTPEEFLEKISLLFRLIHSENAHDNFIKKLSEIRILLGKIYSWDACGKPLKDLLDSLPTPAQQ
jgi:hypothetical protein